MIQLHREIEMEKTDVIHALQKNKAKHIQEYNKAKNGFRHKALRLLEKEAKQIQKGKLRLYVSLVSPVDRKEQFDVAIKMFSSILTPTVKLTTEEYNEYVLDKGNAAKASFVSNSAYFSSAKRAK